MHILIQEALGLLAWLLVGFLVAVAFGSVAREGAGMYGEPSRSRNRCVGRGSSQPRRL
jgi:hypothetical protein